MIVTLHLNVVWYFLAIGNAFSILSDPEKRRKYDLYGSESVTSQHSRRNGEWDYSHGFEAEMTPEEIFNMFFGFTDGMNCG